MFFFLQLKITGLMNDEKLSSQISDWVTSSFSDYLEDNKKIISDIINKFVMENANNIGNSFTINEKLGKIINRLVKLCMPKSSSIIY